MAARSDFSAAAASRDSAAAKDAPTQGHRAVARTISALGKACPKNSGRNLLSKTLVDRGPAFGRISTRVFDNSFRQQFANRVPDFAMEIKLSPVGTTRSPFPCCPRRNRDGR